MSLMDAAGLGPLLWLLAGAAAGLADYGLGIGFGLAASMILTSLAGLDPRSVAAAAAAAQVLTALPALGLHRRSGNIDAERARKAASSLLVLSAFAALSASLASAAASRLPRSHAVALYAVALALLLPAAAPGGRGGRATRHNRLAAAAAGALAGFEKAVAGGGFSIVLALAQRSLGVDLRTAVALTPLVKLPAFALVALVYAAHGYLDAVAALLLAAGAALTLPLAARLLRSARTSHIAIAMSTSIAVSIVVNLLRVAGGPL
jgi:uncharacterized membrane protein YfcA